MTIDDAIAYFGSANKMSQALDISRQAVTRWITEQQIPMRQQYRIERITDGMLTADDEGLKIIKPVGK